MRPSRYARPGRVLKSSRCVVVSCARGRRDFGSGGNSMRPMAKGLALQLISFLLALLWSAGCGTGPSGGVLVESPAGIETRVIKIATQSPLSGPQAVLGEAIKLGAQLAIEEHKGPIENAGFTVKLVPFDDQARANVGVANAQRIAADPNILLVIGHLNSGVALPSSEIYKRVDLAMVSPANTHPLVTDRGYPNVYRVVGRDDVQGAVAAEFARTELHASSAYVIHDRTLYGQGTAELFRTTAQRVGVRVAAFEGTEEKRDFTSLIQDIHAKDPDVVFFGGIYTQAGVFFKQARAAAVRAVFLGPDGMDSSELVTIAGESVVGLHYTTVAGPPTIYPGGREFARRFQSRFGKDPEPYAAEASDATLVGLKALEAVIQRGGGGLPTRQQVSAAIREVRGIQSLTGPIAFDEKGDRRLAQYFVIRVMSSNPSLWGQNQLVKMIAAPPVPRR